MRVIYSIEEATTDRFSQEYTRWRKKSSVKDKLWIIDNPLRRAAPRKSNIASSESEMNVCE